MIAILTKESFYTIAMDTAEFLSLVDEEKVNLTLIRAKSRVHFPKDTLESVINKLESETSKIDVCFCEYGDNKYSMKLVSSIDDLKYYRAQNGNLYTCEEDYNYSISLDLNDTPIVIADETQVGIEENQSKPEDSFEEVPVVVDKEDQTVKPEEVVEEIIEETKQTVELTQEIKDKASALDTVLRRLQPIRRHISESLFASVRKYIDKSKDIVSKKATQQFLVEAGINNIVNDGNTNGIVIQNSLGESADLLDSVVNFPVYSTILSKKDLTSKFSKTQLFGASFIRVCPVGIDENNQLLGIVDIVEFNSQDLNEIERRIKNRLSKEDIKYGSLSAVEKYAEWELETANFHKNIRTILQSRTVGIRNIGEVLEEFKENKYKVNPIFDENYNPIWQTKEIASLDNRILEKKLPKSIENQLSEMKVIKVVELEPVIQHVKVANPDEDEMHRNIASVVKEIMEKKKSDDQPKLEEERSSVIILPEKIESTLAREAAEREILNQVTENPAEEIELATDEVPTNPSVIILGEKSDSTMEQENKSIKMAEFIRKMVDAGITPSRIKINSYDLEGKPIIKPVVPPKGRIVEPNTDEQVVKQERISELLSSIVGDITIGGINPTNPTDENIRRK